MAGSGTNRTPPASVLRQLRNEVNFGCPVNDCGIPYLTWHHFDPPWRVRQHHDPEGMVALCSTHAALADGGRWTPEQLRELKRNPFVTRDSVQESYGYLRRRTVCIIGLVAYDVRNVLTIDNERVIGFERDDDGYDRLNLMIRDSQGSPILVMENNWWTAYIPTLYDLECSARGTRLRVISRDGTTDFELRFKDFSLDEFTRHLTEGIEFTSRELRLEGGVRELALQSMRENKERFISETLGSPSEIPVWSITGRMTWGRRSITMQEFKVLVPEGEIGMGFAAGGETALSIA